MFVQLEYQSTDSGTRTEAIKRAVGNTHTDEGLPRTLLEPQEATPSSQVAQTRSELAVCPNAEQLKKLPPLARRRT